MLFKEASLYGNGLKQGKSEKERKKEGEKQRDGNMNSRKQTSQKNACGTALVQWLLTTHSFDRSIPLPPL